MRSSRAGFTLLEVLVAVAILGLGLTMILSSQVGLFSSASRAEHLTVATNLARCKMTELELELVRDGYPLIDQTDEGRCCADEDEDGYRCQTKVERVELPPPGELPESDGGLGSPDDPSGIFGALTQLQAPQEGSPGSPAALQDMAKDIGSSAMASGLAPMVLGMVYPELKSMLEASIRKVTVTVTWKEGIREKQLTITQYVTDPQQGGMDGDGGVPDAGGLQNLIPGMGSGS
jgi:general secretion pathway protein I